MDAVLMDQTIDDILKHLDILEKTSPHIDFLCGSTKKKTSSGNGLWISDIERLIELLCKIKPEVLHIQNKDAGEVWLRVLKNAINNLNDLFEENSAGHVLLAQQNRFFSFKADPCKNHLKAVKSKIKNVIDDLQYIANKLPMQPTPMPPQTPTPTQATPMEEEAWEKMHFPGREKEKKEIIDQLMQLHANTMGNDVRLPVPVVTIVGSAGIGKKELVSLICKDLQVTALFGVAIRVPDVKSFEEACNEEMNRKDYLVVMEDLESEIGDEDLTKWHQILTGSKSAILITTRSKLVARNIIASIRSNKNIASSFTSFRPHVLQGLNQEESWSLFWRIRGPSSIGIMGEMEQKILMDCGGVPLLIKHIAQFLNNRNSAAAAEDANNLKDEFLQNLKFEYYDKFTRLQKMCFAFCSLFPRDYLIDVERLIRLLKAEGFLMDAENTAVEENLLMYFNDFLGKSIFEVIEEDECGVVKMCKMQPLMLDLACFVSDQEENVTVDPEGEKIHTGVLRASIDFNLDASRGIPTSLFVKANKLRAILLCKTQMSRPKEIKTRSSTIDRIFNTFKTTLRMLDLHDVGINTLPTLLGDMNNIRYLDLSHNTIEKLPGSITKLSNLQTLKLSHCDRLKELPKNIDELTNLNHLEIEGCSALTHMPRKIRKLGDSLQTVTLFVVSKYHFGGLADLASLNNLRGHLEISHLEISGLNLSKKNSYLKKKKHLQHLILRWDHQGDHEEKEEDTIRDMKTLECLEPHSDLRTIFLVGYKGKTLSNWFSSIQCLVRLRLYNCPSCIFLPHLNQLPKLRILKLRRLDKLQYIAEENGSEKDKLDALYFPSLEELTVSDCPNLKSWWKEDKTGNDLPFFASVSKLHVYCCPKLTCMPLFPDLDVDLILEGSSMKPLQDTIVYGKGRYNPFSKLKSLKITSVEQDRQQDPPEEWIKCFKSLEKLDIKEWKHLKSLPKGFSNLTSLQSLKIESCQELDLDYSSNEWEGLKNLSSLTIRENSKLKSLPLGLDKVTSLQDLQLHNCPHLTTLHETIDKLKSLRMLEISECNKLASLPKALKNMDSLHTLKILDCTLLLPRCQPNIGDDWPHIAHIKNKQLMPETGF